MAQTVGQGTGEEPKDQRCCRLHRRGDADGQRAVRPNEHGDRKGNQRHLITEDGHRVSPPEPGEVMAPDRPLP